MNIWRRLNFFDNLVYNVNQMLNIRISLLATILICGLQSVTAQNQKPNTNYGFGGPSLSIGSIANQQAIYFGGLGGYSYNDFYFGGMGFGLVNGSSINLDRDGSTHAIYDFGVGGLLLGYHKYYGILGGYVQGVVGSGGGRIADLENFSVVMLQPELGALVRFNPWMQLGMGLGYQRGFISSGTYLNNNDFKALSFHISLRFG